MKIEKPLIFTGKHTELNNFLFVMQQYIDTVALGTGSSACRFLTSYLRDDALTWWRSYSNDDLTIFDHITLDVLVDELRNQFSDIDREMKVRDKLLQLK